MDIPLASFNCFTIEVRGTISSDSSTFDQALSVL